MAINKTNVENELYNTWDSEMGKATAYKESFSDLMAYDSIPNSRATAGFSSHDRNFINIESNTSVRPSFNRGDYNSFRSSEALPARQKKIMKLCMDAYDRVGIVRNVIDLMSDFACQGMSIVHPVKQVEQFYRSWFKHVGGIERSERFLNYLYRIGNVIVERKTAKVKKKNERELKAYAADVEIEDIDYTNREIPWQYDFINPTTLDYEKDANGRLKLYKKINSDSLESLQKSNSFSDFGKVDVKNKRIEVNLDSVSIYYYKKDDWLPWANPMIYAILDDLVMLEKMKLADLAALDGAVSNIRLWTLGDLEHKIIPKKAVMDKLRDILACNVGGGTMDLVWGPELKFQESNSQVYKWLGSEKYQPVLTSIYAGLGIPPTLTGSGGGGGFTNNFISLKTLIERLEYGRETLTRFWEKEIKIVQKAMGFKDIPKIHFDTIVLSDEAAMKNLLIQLVDRDIISEETVIERFGEIPEIEKIRILRENKMRMRNPARPNKASPYHNPQHSDDIAKVALTKEMLPKEYFDKLGLPYQEPPKPPVGAGGAGQQRKVTPNANGRPKLRKDSGPRKQKRVLPRSGSSKAIWAISAQDKISESVNVFALSNFNKKTLRNLTKAETDQLEYLKLCILTGIEPFMEIDNDVIFDLLQRKHRPSAAYAESVSSLFDDFQQSNSRKPTAEEQKHIYAMAYAESCFIEEEE